MKLSPELQATFARVRILLMDVDGVLTDGSFWWGPNGEEFKRFGRENLLMFVLYRSEEFEAL